MKYIFLLNRFSLKNKTNDVYKKVETVATKMGYDYIIEVNSLMESTEDILKRYKEGKNIIIAIGGDGTINRVLNSIVGTDNILGFIPYGTGNDFYKAALELLKNGISKVDLGKINDKYFINVVCFGIDADIGNNQDIIHSKFIPEKQRYNMSLIHHFIRYKVRDMKVTINNKEYSDSYTTVCVCNGRYYGGGYKVGFRSSLTDNKLDVYLVSKMRKSKMIPLILGMNKGKHEDSKYTKKISTNSLLIESENNITCNVDGEQLTSKVFDIKLIHKGISIFYDKELINNFYNK